MARIFPREEVARDGVGARFHRRAVPPPLVLAELLLDAGAEGIEASCGLALCSHVGDWTEQEHDVRV